MRSRPLKTLCLLALVACAPLAQAQIYHCIGAHGEPVFSGEPCGTPAPRSPRTGPASGTGAICADSPQALRRAIADAFTSDDVNLFASLILWRGVGPGATRARLRSLIAWLQQPLLGIAPAFAPGTPYAGTGPPPFGTSTSHPDAGTGRGPPPLVGFAISTARSTRNFGLLDAGRCWWLTF